MAIGYSSPPHLTSTSFTIKEDGMYLYGKLKNHDERQLSVGSIAAVNGASVTVASASEASETRLIAIGGQTPSYSVGDRVLIAEMGGILYVVGKII